MKDEEKCVDDAHSMQNIVDNLQEFEIEFEIDKIQQLKTMIMKDIKKQVTNASKVMETLENCEEQ